jgi:hypothetical protein
MRQLDPEVLTRAKRFLQRLAEHDGCCDREQAGSASDRKEDRARQICKQREFARYESGYWRLTDFGRKALEGYIVW